MQLSTVETTAAQVVAARIRVLILQAFGFRSIYQGSKGQPHSK